MLPSQEVSSFVEGATLQVAAASYWNPKSQTHAILQVREVMTQFEMRLFQLMRDIVAVGSDAPDVLTTCMRIIEIQEQIDLQAPGAHPLSLCLPGDFES